MRYRTVAAATLLVVLMAGCSPTNPPREDRLLSGPWALLSGEPEDRVIRVLVTDSSCLRFDRLEVDESRGGQIVVTAWNKYFVPAAAQGCNASLAYDTATYELQAPVGSRSFVPAPVSPEFSGPKVIDEDDVRSFLDQPEPSESWMTPRPPPRP